MKEVRLLQTTQVRLFPPDVIPLQKVALAEFAQALESLFHFQAVGPVERAGGVPGIAFTGGVYKPGEVVVESVVLEARRILVKVLGKTEVANSVYYEVSKQLEELSGGISLNELVCTHETSTSVVLDFPFERLLSPEFASFINDSATRYTKNKWSTNFIVPANLKFTVRYKITDDSLIANSISLSPKVLSIEPRGQSTVEDRLYWVESPTDTETHFKLIAELEKTLV